MKILNYNYRYKQGIIFQAHQAYRSALQTYLKLQFRKALPTIFRVRNNGVQTLTRTKWNSFLLGGK
jgi:hypothetical protein